MLEFQNRFIKLPNGDPVSICRIKGSIDGSTIREFEEKLLGFTEQGIKHLIVVFSEVDYINSSGMGILVKVTDKYKEIGGDINLVDVPDKLVALFTMLGLVELIKLSKTEEEAINNFLNKSKSQQKFIKSQSSVKPVKPRLSVQSSNISPKKRSIYSPTKTPIQTPINKKQKKAAIKNMNSTSSKTAQKVKKKIFVIKCKKCHKKISLGSTLKPGNYRCPNCKSIFEILPEGKIRYKL